MYQTYVHFVQQLHLVGHVSSCSPQTMLLKLTVGGGACKIATQMIGGPIALGLDVLGGRMVLGPAVWGNI